MCHFFLVYTWCHFFLCPFFLCLFFLCLFFRCHFFRLPPRTCLGYIELILIPGPTQWGSPYSPRTTCLGYIEPILIPRPTQRGSPYSPRTTCLGYIEPILSAGPHSGGALTHLVQHVWDTLNLFYPRAHTAGEPLLASYMSGIH